MTVITIWGDVMGRTIGRLAAIAVFLTVQQALLPRGEIKVFSTIRRSGQRLRNWRREFEQATGE